MKLGYCFLGGALAFAGVFFRAPEAKALGPIDVEIAGKFGMGTNPSDQATPFGFGVGGRGGVAFKNIYGGLKAMYYFGEKDELLGGSISNNSLLYGLEGGYGFKFSIITIRPQLGIGNVTFSTDAGGISSSSSHVYLEPGVTALVKLGLLFVGADANVLVVPGVDTLNGSTTWAAFTLNGQVGVGF